MLLPSSIQRADDLVGMATPTVPFSCACTAPTRLKAPRATAANVIENVFKVVLPFVRALASIIETGASAAFFARGLLVRLRLPGFAGWAGLIFSKARLPAWTDPPPLTTAKLRTALLPHK